MVRLRNEDPELYAHRAQTKERRLGTRQERSTVFCYTASPSTGLLADFRPSGREKDYYYTRKGPFLC